MAAHSLKMIQKIPAPAARVWDLFSRSANLLQLTPPQMDVRIISAPDEQTIYPGQIIEYKLKPLWGLRVHWVTEMKEVEHGKFFMDKQLKGPYRLWEHKHYFKEIEGGVEMTDIVHYKIPAGLLGKIVNAVLVKKKLQKLFEYRFSKVEELFGKWKDQEPLIGFS